MSPFDKASLAMNRRALLGGAGSLGLAAALGGLGLRPALAADSDAAWSAPVDIEKAKAEVAEFVSYGMPDNWANYGEVLQKLQEAYEFKLTRSRP